MKSSKKTDEFFWKENFEDFTGKEARRYHEGVSDTPFNLRLYDRLMTDLLSKYLLGGPMKILDAGGGTGKWAVYFAQMGHRVTLMDISEPMLKVAEAVVRAANLQDSVSIEQGTITGLRYETGRFDFVFCDRNPISHCGKMEASHSAVKELCRVLKPGGVIIASVLNKYRKMAQLVSELDLEKAKSFLAEGDLMRGEGTHTHYYTIEELGACLKEAGFQEPRLFGTTVFAEWIPTAWLLNENVVDKLYELEAAAREIPDLSVYGVRLHFVAHKG